MKLYKPPKPDENKQVSGLEFEFFCWGFNWLMRYFLEIIEAKNLSDWALERSHGRLEATLKNKIFYRPWRAEQCLQYKDHRN